MNTAPDLTISTAIAATDPTKAAAAPRIKLLSHGFSIDHPNRYRSQGEPAITVQNVSVGDGGKAIVGNVTQHASVIVSDKGPAAAARKTPKAAGSRRRSASADAKREAQA